MIFSKPYRLSVNGEQREKEPKETQITRSKSRSSCETLLIQYMNGFYSVSTGEQQPGLGHFFKHHPPMYLAHKNITMAEPEALRTYRIEFGLPFLLFALMAIIPRRNPAQFGLKIAYLP